MLVTYSEYFYRYFDFESQQDNKSRHSNGSPPTIITICDFTANVYRAYLHFIYTGSINENFGIQPQPLISNNNDNDNNNSNNNQLTIETKIIFLVQLTELAMLYEEDDLLQVCLNYLISPDSKLLQINTALFMYNQAYQCRTVPVIEKCLEFITKNCSEMLNKL